MKLTRIKLSSEECIERLNEVCEGLGIDIEENKKTDHIVVKLLREGEDPGTIRIYDTKLGRTLDGSLNNKMLNDTVLSEFNIAMSDVKITPKHTLYLLREDQFEEIYDVIVNVASRNDYEINKKEQNPSHITYLVEVSNRNNRDKVTITQFNKGKLMLQGMGWEVWDEVCNSIDEALDTSVEEITLRLMGSVAEDVAQVVMTDLTSRGETEIVGRLGRAFSFLYDHDKKLLISSQSMLLAKIDYGDYYCYIAPCLRVIEGYLKKVIVELGLLTETQINALDTNGKPLFNFGQIFNGLSHVHSTKKTLLSSDPSIQDQIEAELLVIYESYQKTRNPLQHDGPPVQMTVDTYEDAESYFDEIIGMINRTYHQIF
ncbi:type II toxin-antitoxin system RnlA family toxin [Paenibacillus lactis]|uniref:Bacterial toxin RNase RnlA/LsoA DBD domain-containing protein n=1 Tax=Paenibacillus lactis TaxID=228574 RepID=A0ABS4FGN4_9BACL|nr:type II toxin-antitoxin system RnlA family toxin [Paenibacillus lactis]MBP1895421.1 hypothetical protein [Paenibacillus lactis]